MDKREITNEAVKIIRRHLPGKEFEIVLFGSWARGDAQESSDIDLGLVGPEPVDDMTLLRIKEEINCIPTLRRIDVVDLSKTDETFRKDVLSYAQVISQRRFLILSRSRSSVLLKYYNSRRQLSSAIRPSNASS